MDWRTIFVLLHVFATILGVGGVTFALIFSRQAMRDGKVDASEGAFLHTTYTIMRTGLIILVLSGFGIVLVGRLTGGAEHLYSVRLWLKLTLTGILLMNTILLATRKLPDWLAHGISLTGWYGALVLGVWRGYHWSYFVGIGAYVLITLFVALLIRDVPVHQKVHV